MADIIGDRVFDLRKRHGLTLEAFARRIGSSRDGVWCIETERRGSTKTSTLKRICLEFGVSADWLLGLKDQE